MEETDETKSEQYICRSEDGNVAYAYDEATEAWTIVKAELDPFELKDGYEYGFGLTISAEDDETWTLSGVCEFDMDDVSLDDLGDNKANLSYVSYVNYRVLWI